jgi:hypothetical protein
MIEFFRIMNDLGISKYSKTSIYEVTSDLLCTCLYIYDRMQVL